MNSSKGRKIGLIAKVLIFLYIPNILGKLIFKIFPSTKPKDIDIFLNYAVGFLVFTVLFFITWILRAIFIWFFDDTGEKDPWQWGYFMNDDNYKDGN